MLFAVLPETTCQVLFSILQNKRGIQQRTPRLTLSYMISITIPVLHRIDKMQGTVGHFIDHITRLLNIRSAMTGKNDRFPLGFLLL